MEEIMPTVKIAAWIVLLFSGYLIGRTIEKIIVSFLAKRRVKTQDAKADEVEVITPSPHTDATS